MSGSNESSKALAVLLLLLGFRNLWLGVIYCSVLYARVEDEQNENKVKAETNVSTSGLFFFKAVEDKEIELVFSYIMHCSCCLGHNAKGA